MFSTIFCDVPAFSRVDPVTTSGPTSDEITIFASRATGMCRFDVIATVVAPRFRAYRIAPSTYGVVPLAVIPTTTSCRVNLLSRNSRSAFRTESSAPSTAPVTARLPPAISACTNFGGVPNVLRAFRRIQHRHPPARSRPCVNQPPTFADPVHNRVHRPRNRANLSPHRRRHLAVLAVHQSHDLQRRHPIKVFRSRIPLFREPVIRAATIRAPVFFSLRGHHRIISVRWNTQEKRREKNTSFAARSLTRHR